MPSNAELVGIEYTTAKFGKRFQGIAIGAIRPLFLEGKELKPGDWCGTPHGTTATVKAKAGYSASAVEVSTGGRIMGIRVKFGRMQSGPDAKSYWSDWAGVSTDKTTKLDCQVGALTGLFGSWNKEASGEWPTTIRSLGIISTDSGE